MKPIARTAAKLALAAALIITLAACKSSGADSTDQTPTPPPSPELIAGAQAAAADSLLTLADLPAGWIESPPDDDPDLALEGDCAILAVDHFPSELAGTESADLEGPVGQQADSSASVFATRDEAAAMYESFTSAASDCKDDLLAAFDRAIREELVAEGTSSDSIQALDISMEGIESTVLADSSQAYRFRLQITVDGRSLELIEDVVVMRQGRVLGSFTYVTTGEPNQVESDQLAAVVAGKLDAGDASLPA